MNRRDAIQYVTFLMGGTLVLGSTGFLIGCKNDKKVFNDFLSMEEIDLINEIGETIIPTTDTPGAKAAGVGNFMAIMVKDCYNIENQSIFKGGLKKISENFQKAYGHSYTDGSVNERNNYIGGLEQEYESYAQNKNEGDPEHYYKMLKELTLLGFFTSEIGCVQALSYVEIPGSYSGCIPFVKGTKAWAT